jgi:Family of unknown function (DUF6191)
MSFLEIFQPGLKHLHEERDRQRTQVIRPAQGAGPPLGIDLEAGTASIVVQRRPAPTGEAANESTEDGSEPKS